ncbi:MAG TPA: sigma-70 family RNA polymerase sigma factor [Myxococcota bacterium]|nr:sigma-70 family RNA polymerase sigma factor [Myxococcota bacterium]
MDEKLKAAIPRPDEKASGDTPPKDYFSVRQRQRPGPPGADTLGPPDQDLEDASLILSLVEKGRIETRLPWRDLTRDRVHLTGKERLSAEVEAELALRVQRYSDLDARNCLVMSNIGLVHLVANQFSRPPVRYEDLVQEGTMGLIRATETFEPGRGVRFSTYSVYWIRAKIQRLLQKIERDDIPAIIGAEMLQDDKGRRRRPRARKLSIEHSQEDEDSRNLSELLPSEVKNPEHVALQIERDKVIKEVLFGIVDELGDERLNTIIEWRLLAEEPETLTNVGARLNLSREGARLLEAKMLKLAKQRLKKWRTG